MNTNPTTPTYTDIVGMLEVLAEMRASCKGPRVGINEAIIEQWADRLAAALSGGEVFGWWCAKNRRFYRSGEWGNAPCDQCVPLYTILPAATKGEQE